MTDHSKGLIITILAVLFIIPDSLFIRLLSAVLNEKISKRMLWTIIFALTGVLLISYGSSQDQSTSIYGDLCAVGCAASYGIALTFARKSKAKSMIPVTPFALFMSGVVFLPWASPFIFDGLDAQYALFHNLLIAASTCLLVLGPRYIPSAEVALLILGESILAPILIWLVIGEYRILSAKQILHGPCWTISRREPSTLNKGDPDVDYC